MQCKQRSDCSLRVGPLMLSRRVGKGEAHKSTTVDDKMEIAQGEYLGNQLQLHGFLPGRKRVVRFNDEASKLPCQELEIAVGGPFRGEVLAKSVVEGCAACFIKTWRFFKFLTEHIE
jgi:hypothetical protein